VSLSAVSPKAGAVAPANVVIVGAGQAGGRCALALRAAGFTGRITLVGQEAHPPYERPALSKEMLLAPGAETIAWVSSSAEYALAAIELRLGLAVVAIDRIERKVLLEDGSFLDYDVLVLTTGARARTLQGTGVGEIPVRVLRTIEDSRALRDALRPGVRLAVVGAGLIGLEVAAAARHRGAEVTVLEDGERVMSRSVPREISDHHAALHRDHGVVLELGARVVDIRREFGSARLTLANGKTVRADLVVAGIGVEPNDELAQQAGLRTQRGIVVDSFGRTTDPCVFAAGDVARHYNPLLGTEILLESWQNAQNQAIAVARVIAGGSQPYAEIPWFWSDQFGVNLQITGLPVPGARSITRGTLGKGPAVVVQIQDGRIVCACAVNAARELRYVKELITLGARVDEQVIADPAIRLNDIVRDIKHGPTLARADK
jgi:NADPH-dependent 2,4-dienoyl-CoA reductase/sulfur reductase-like enzyme